MTKTIILILVSMFVAACGGEPFSTTEFSAIGGDGEFAEAGAGVDSAGTPAAAGRAGAAQGGAPGAGGSSAGSAGKSGAGGAVAGNDGAGGASGGTAAGSAGATTGGTGAACVFDEAKLTALLPESLTWQDLDATRTSTGGECMTHVTCKSSPCSTINVSWGKPQAVGPVEGHPKNTYIYAATADASTVAFKFDTSGAGCEPDTECTAERNGISVTLTVAPKADGKGWRVQALSTYTNFSDNSCLETHAGGVSTEMGEDLRTELTAQLDAAMTGLDLPCK